MIKIMFFRATEKKTKNGQSFMTFKAKKNDGTWVQLKFTKNVKDLPEENGIYNFSIETTDMNKSMTDFGECYWAKSVNKYEVAEQIDTAIDEF